MAITEADIKLLKSERMQDTDDGGGRMTGQEVVDGESNNIFPDISELDRTYGRVSLRKLFPAVLTSDTSVYYGANVIVAEPPEDEFVHASIFRIATDDMFFNEREEARNKLESYLAIGPVAPMRLVGNHYEGQRSILCYQLQSDPLPGAGEVYVLKDDTHEQYVRVLSVESRVATYYDDKGAFERLELTLEISDPLRYDFEAGSVSRYTYYDPPTKIHRTNVVEAVSYYGVSPLAQATDLGAMTIRVDRYKTPLVPSTQAESAMLDIPAGSVRTVDVSGGTRSDTVNQVSYTYSYAIEDANRQYNYVFQLTPKPAPGTLEVSYRSRDKWYVIFDEASDGSLTGEGSGTVNYATGSVSVTLRDLPDTGTAIMLGWGTGDKYIQGSSIDVDLPQYRHTVAHPPIAPSSVSITWDAGGSPKTITDDGAGNLTGDGTGYVLYGDGLVVFRPTELPDPDTSPLLSYQGYFEPVQEDFQDVPVVNDEATVTLQAQPDAGSVRVKYTVRAFTANVDTPGFKVICQGVTVATGQGPVQMPNGSTLEVVAESNTRLRIGMTASASGDLPFGSLDLVNKTVTVPTEIQYYAQHAVYDTVCRANPCGNDPQTGLQMYCTSCGPEFQGYDWNTTTSATTSIDGTVDINVDYIAQGTQLESYDENVPGQSMLVRLQPASNAAVVPGTVQFRLSGHTFIDIEGEIHMDPDPGTGVGTPAGTIDYQTGDVTLTYWATGTFSFALDSLLLEVSPRLTTELTWRTASAPCRPASLTLAVMAEDGELLTASADLDGNVTGDWVDGGIDVQTGVVGVRFGQYRQASTLTEEEKAGWYREEDVLPDGTIWMPRKVIPNTARYNVVVYVYMPLSADILGLDPVRLPMDGQVPIFRVGDVIVVHHTQTTTIASPSNGQVIDTGRVRLSYAKLFDGNGDPVPTDRYTVDLDAGTVILVDVSGLVTPLSLEDRIEDMALVSDLEINGTLQLTRALSHAYPAGSYVSSALVIGDMWARVGGFFSQATWTGEWSDERIGSDTTGKYNRTAYPIEVTNKGTITERWAIIFTSSTTFKLVGEYVGQIALGDITSDFAPLNPETGEPYFVVRAGGWGSGWATGNVLRMNTIGANYPIWVARTVLQSEAASGSDRFRICIRGDVDTP